MHPTGTLWRRCPRLPPDGCCTESGRSARRAAGEPGPGGCLSSCRAWILGAGTLPAGISACIYGYRSICPRSPFRTVAIHLDASATGSTRPLVLRDSTYPRSRGAGRLEMGSARTTLPRFVSLLRTWTRHCTTVMVKTPNSAGSACNQWLWTGPHPIGAPRWCGVPCRAAGRSAKRSSPATGWQLHPARLDRAATYPRSTVRAEAVAATTHDPCVRPAGCRAMMNVSRVVSYWQTRPRHG